MAKPKDGGCNQVRGVVLFLSAIDGDYVSEDGFGAKAADDDALDDLSAASCFQKLRFALGSLVKVNPFLFLRPSPAMKK